MRFSTPYLAAVLLTILSLSASLCAQSTSKEAAKVPHGSISGRVTIKDRGVPGVAVGLRKGDIFSPFEPYQRTTTDQDGYYRIPNLAPGSYSIVAAVPAFVMSDAKENRIKNVLVGEDENGVTSAKSGDQLTGVTITLAEGAASIRGHVQPGTIFYLIPAEPDKATDVLRFFATDVASDGAFSLNNLPPGKYLALTQANIDAQITTQAKLREPETEAATARAKLRRAAETKKTEIELKPCQNLADYQLKQ